MSQFTIMFVADVCGKVGRQALAHMAKPLRERFGADYVIANTENAAGGFGITPEMAKKVFAYGVDIQTSGNHIWDRYDIVKYLMQRPKLLRPANFPDGVPGMGYYIDTADDVKVGIIDLMGRTYMKDIDCPFMVGKKIVEQMRQETKIIFVDMHAEATSEKQAMLYWLDGKVTAVIGTHTHVPTADEHVTSLGTAYITDAGMTGPYDSIIGMDKEPSLQRFLTGMPKRFSTAEGDVRIAGVVVRLDSTTGRALSIERFMFPFDIDTFSPEDVLPEQEDDDDEHEELE